MPPIPAVHISADILPHKSCRTAEHGEWRNFWVIVRLFGVITLSPAPSGHLHIVSRTEEGLGMRITLLLIHVQVIPVAVVLASGRSRTVAEALGLIANVHSLRTIIKPRL